MSVSPLRLRFIGNTDDGYLAEYGMAECRVRKVGRDRWTAWFYGSTRRNPEYITDDGCIARSCMSPKVDVDGEFTTRRAAAVAGLRAYAEDHRHRGGYGYVFDLK